MGYASVVEVDQILAQSLTNARSDSSLPSPIIAFGNERHINTIPNDVIEYYISLADQEIDSVLSEQYYTPLRKCASGEWNLENDITEYNQQLEISDATNLVPGDEILIRDEITGQEEVHIVRSIIDQNTIATLDTITTFFTAENVVVKRLSFPPPISQVSARYAAAFIYDKYFSAQASPNISEYGTAMRAVAEGHLNDILNGKTILYCQKRRGDRFGDPWVDDTYQHRDRGYSVSDRNKSNVLR